jgi:4-hydroxybenzoate polyprenyltransferase
LKGIDSILFYLSLGLFVIATHQAFIIGISSSYWIFMCSLSLLFLYSYRKNKRNNSKDNPKLEKKSRKGPNRQKKNK